MHFSQHHIALAELIEIWQSNNYAADKVFRRYSQARRYIGARDRRILQAGFYYYLRHKLTVEYVMTQASLPDDDMARAQSAFYLWGEHPHHDELCQPLKAVLPETETLMAQLPSAVKMGMPEFLFDKLNTLPKAEDLLQALAQQAPITLRCGDSDGLYDAFVAEGVTVEKGKLSPLALHVQQRLSVDMPALHQRQAEYQDEGAQIVAWLCLHFLLQSAPLETGKVHFLDYCVGSGGKIFAMADFASRLFSSMVPMLDYSALNIDSRNREKLHQRLKKYRKSYPDYKLRIFHQATQIKNKFKMVLADVPCSLTGTLRRNPDRKWKITQENLQQLQNTQMEIMQGASALVKNEGYLCYVTCSLLPEENQLIIDKFLASDAGQAFQPVDLRVFASSLPKELSDIGAEMDNSYLQLRPDIHGCDGFFIAFLQRKSPELKSV